MRTTKRERSAKYFLGVARAVAPADLDLARALMAAVRHEQTTARGREPTPQLLAVLASVVQVADPAHARGLLEEAEPLVTESYAGPLEGTAILAAAWGPLDAQRAHALARRAEQLWAEQLERKPWRPAPDEHLVRALVWSDPERAIGLAREHGLVPALAGQPGIDGRRLVTESTDPLQTALLLEESAEPSDTDWWVARARAVAPRLVVERRVRLLARVAAVVAPGPARELIAEAERELDSVLTPDDHPRAAAEVACAVAVHDPDRAERLAEAVGSPRQRATVLLAVAHSLHRRLDPVGSAERSPRRPPAPV
jgi:hypothetical protein